MISPVEVIKMNEIYKRIKQRREELGMSQEELASKLGYKNRSSIHKIEMGVNDIPQSKIKDFASALNTTPIFLMGLEKSKTDKGYSYYTKEKQDIINSLDELSTEELAFVKEMISRMKK
jgi:transcriptional regulator with XRE-family HTH domain